MFVLIIGLNLIIAHSIILKDNKEEYNINIKLKINFVSNIIINLYIAHNNILFSLILDKIE